ncbi:MAG: sugar ABC transporter ATP-binding protein [Hyphomicrobiales bacterium]|nr:sugar ABC transporter ATP-binding protein [Hyphomicrobiales bacterium]
MSQPLAELRHISKTFGGVHAIEDVDIDIFPGEVMGLLGHNGAGKSTLIKVLSGVYPPDHGEIRIAGQAVRIETTREAKALGVETIYQDLALAENLDAVANLFLGRERHTRFGFLDEEAMEHETRIMLDRMKLRLPSLRTEVSRLSGGQRQAIAIGRAVYFDAKIIIMDEPTAALGPEETEKVGELVRELKTHGLGIVLISHDIHDVFDLADRVTVLSHGRVVGTVRTSDTTKDEVLSMIILGRMPNGRDQPGTAIDPAS